MMDMVLQPGDLLYMPRGTIHQGNCLEDAHSLHITVSCHQLNTYGDLLEKLLPAAIKAAQEQDIAFRQGLPTNYLSNLGVAYEENEENPERNRFMSKVQSLMGKLFEYAPVDSAVDQMGKRFMHTALPPYLSSQESNRYTYLKLMLFYHLPIFFQFFRTFYFCPIFLLYPIFNFLQLFFVSRAIENFNLV